MTLLNSADCDVITDITLMEIKSKSEIRDEKINQVLENKIYEFLYNSNIWESAFQTISCHRTRAGAEKAMGEHKAKAKEKFDKLYKNNPGLKIDIEFGEHEDWQIGETELLD